MNVRNRLRNSLVRKIQHLSTKKLAEIDNILSKIEKQIHSKEKTLKLAGKWKEIDNEIFSELTHNLHKNRSKDRQIEQL